MDSIHHRSPLRPQTLSCISSIHQRRSSRISHPIRTSVQVHRESTKVRRINSNHLTQKELVLTKSRLIPRACTRRELVTSDLRFFLNQVNCRVRKVPLLLGQVGLLGNEHNWKKDGLRTYDTVSCTSEAKFPR